MSDRYVMQKTVSRRLTLACGHEQRIRLDVPRPIMTRSKFDAWAEGAFVTRQASPCPACSAAAQCEGLDADEAALTANMDVALDRFESEPIAIATYARSIRNGYYKAVGEYLDRSRPTDGNVAFVLLAALLAPGHRESEAVARTVRDLVLRHLVARGSQFEARYWITNKRRMASTAERDARNPEFLIPALIVALAGCPDMEQAHAAYRATFRPATDADRDLATAGITQGLAAHDVLSRIAFLHGLARHDEPG